MSSEDRVLEALRQQALEAIKERSRLAKPVNGSQSLQSCMLSLKDVPVLIEEVERLLAQNKRLVDHSAEMRRERELLQKLHETVQYAMDETETCGDGEGRYVFSQKNGDAIKTVLDELKEEPDE
jgi:hypothetical protein